MMESTLRYFLLANALLLLHGLYFRLVISRMRRFSWNRAFIWIGVVVSFIAPLPWLPNFGPALPGIVEITLPTVVVGPADVSTGTGFDWMTLLVLGYGAISMLLIAGIIWQVLKVVRIIRIGKRERREGFTLVRSKELGGPATFFRFILWDDRLDANPESAFVAMAHERCHSQQLHSLDALLMDLIRAIFWINPGAWLLSSDLRQTQEYLADEAASKAASSEAVSRLMLDQQIQLMKSTIAHAFHSFSRRRLKMLGQPRSPRWAYIVVFPMIIAMVVLGCAKALPDEDLPEIAAESMPENFQEKPDLAPSPQNLGTLGVQYPDAAKNRGIEGKVVARLLVNERGLVQQSKIVKQPHPLLVAAVAAKVPNLVFTPAIHQGKPVKAWITIPFAFVLSNEKRDSLRQAGVLPR
ncbi:MAG: M56 family metallopeptidase [Bacteroidia bacterium]